MFLIKWEKRGSENCKHFRDPSSAEVYRFWKEWGGVGIPTRLKIFEGVFFRSRTLQRNVFNLRDSNEIRCVHVGGRTKIDNELFSLSTHVQLKEGRRRAEKEKRTSLWTRSRTTPLDPLC